ncbi:helix-turn-helix domain-containing protein [Streptomyces sp. NPDC058284]|uniref:helix-turn-helix domain-containing protein n=1 Tax=Streptomyces sp. NPDC058284 TaxID=3346421 RepID=UPI0036E6930F
MVLGGGCWVMVLRARPGRDKNERDVVRRLSRARKAPRDAVMRARMIELSWSGLRVPAIAVELGCSQKTVRRWLHRFNRSGLQGLDDLGGQGRKRRITEEERSRVIALVKTVPPGRLRWEPVGELWAFDESGPPEWTLDSLAAAARAEGIEVGRSQVRRILLGEGVRWRRTRSWTRSKDPDFVPKGQGSSGFTPTRPTVRR